MAHSTATTLKLLQHGSGALVTSAWFASAVAEVWNKVPQESWCEKLTDEDVDEMILEADSERKSSCPNRSWFDCWSNGDNGERYF